MRSNSGDRTARARIRDAAINRFAQDGLGASVRSIAADAGVSPGLIIHHFGSRAGLREACDEHVQSVTGQSKQAVFTPTVGAEAMLLQLAEAPEYAPVIGYILRCLQAGGPQAAGLVERMVAEAEAYFEQGVREGTVTASRDPAGRARLLTEMSLGCLLLQLPAQSERLVLEALPQWLSEYTARMILPVLELCTEPILSDSSLLDAYLASTERASTEGTTP